MCYSQIGLALSVSGAAGIVTLALLMLIHKQTQKSAQIALLKAELAQKPAANEAEGGAARRASAFLARKFGGRAYPRVEPRHRQYCAAFGGRPLGCGHGADGGKPDCDGTCGGARRAKAPARAGTVRRGTHGGTGTECQCCADRACSSLRPLL